MCGNSYSGRVTAFNAAVALLAASAAAGAKEGALVESADAAVASLRSQLGREPSALQEAALRATYASLAANNAADAALHELAASVIRQYSPAGADAHERVNLAKVEATVAALNAAEGARIQAEAAVRDAEGEDFTPTGEARRAFLSQLFGAPFGR